MKFLLAWVPRIRRKPDGDPVSFRQPKARPGRWMPPWIQGNVPTFAVLAAGAAAGISCMPQEISP
jgi:hypothetical protein